MNNLFVELLSRSKTLELVTEPSLALTVFRVTPPEAHKYTLEEINELNTRFFKTMSARDDIMITQTNLNGTICIRFAVGSANTKEPHIRNAYDIIEREAAATIESWLKGKTHSA